MMEVQWFNASFVMNGITLIVYQLKLKLMKHLICVNVVLLIKKESKRNRILLNNILKFNVIYPRPFQFCCNYIHLKNVYFILFLYYILVFIYLYKILKILKYFYIIETFKAKFLTNLYFKFMLF